MYQYDRHVRRLFSDKAAHFQRPRRTISVESITRQSAVSHQSPVSCAADAVSDRLGRQVVVDVLLLGELDLRAALVQRVARRARYALARHRRRRRTSIALCDVNIERA